MPYSWIVSLAVMNPSPQLLQVQAHGQLATLYGALPASVGHLCALAVTATHRSRQTRKAPPEILPQWCKLRVLSAAVRFLAELLSTAQWKCDALVQLHDCTCKARHGHYASCSCAMLCIV